MNDKSSTTDATLVMPQSEEKKTIKKSATRVRSWWPREISGVVLVESDGDFRLLPAEDWPNARSFKLDNFDDLERPKAFNLGGLDNEYLWKAGIVARGIPQQAAVQQALHTSGSSLSVEDVIEMLKV